MSFGVIFGTEPLLLNDGFRPPGLLLYKWNLTKLQIISEAQKSLKHLSPTKKYLITEHNDKTMFIWVEKKDKRMLLNWFCINLNATHVNGMTHFHLA